MADQGSAEPNPHFVVLCACVHRSGQRNPPPGYDEGVVFLWYNYNNIPKVYQMANSFDVVFKFLATLAVYQLLGTYFQQFLTCRQTMNNNYDLFIVSQIIYH